MFTCYKYIHISYFFSFSSLCLRDFFILCKLSNLFTYNYSYYFLIILFIYVVSLVISPPSLIPDCSNLRCESSPLLLVTLGKVLSILLIFQKIKFCWFFSHVFQLSTSFISTIINLSFFLSFFLSFSLSLFLSST